MATNPVAPPDTSDLPVSSNLASAISDGGSGLAALAIPSEAPGPRTGGSLQSAIAPSPDTLPAPSPQAAYQGAPDTLTSSLQSVLDSTQPAQAKFQPTIGSRLRGVLMGLATGGVPAAVAGGISPTFAQERFDQRRATAAANVQFAQNRAQFESAQAALTHVQALNEATRIDNLNEESRARIQQLNDAHAKFLSDEYGIVPDVNIEGNGADTHAQANGALGTLAAENNGWIPPVHTLVQPHAGDQSTFNIGVYAPSQLDLQKNQQGFRSAVDDARAVQGLVPIDDQSWGTLGFKGQRQMAQEALSFLAPVQPFTEQNIGAILAQRKQQLASYLTHTNVNGVPDAKPALVAQLQKSVDLLQAAQSDVNTSQAQAASKKEEAIATNPNIQASKEAVAAAEGRAKALMDAEIARGSNAALASARKNSLHQRQRQRQKQERITRKQNRSVIVCKP
jgi:hypothetical protein